MSDSGGVFNSCCDLLARLIVGPSLGADIHLPLCSDFWGYLFELGFEPDGPEARVDGPVRRMVHGADGRVRPFPLFKQGFGGLCLD